MKIRLKREAGNGTEFRIGSVRGGRAGLAQVFDYGVDGLGGGVCGSWGRKTMQSLTGWSGISIAEFDSLMNEVRTGAGAQWK